MISSFVEVEVERKMYFEEELDCPINKISFFIHQQLSGQTGVGKLSAVTHIVDCECFQIEGEKIYREISIFYLEKLEYEVLQCYAEDFCSFRKMTKKNKKSIKYAFRIHGLYFFNTLVRENYLSQCELFNYLKKKYFKKIFYSDIREVISSLLYFVI